MIYNRTTKYKSRPLPNQKQPSNPPSDQSPSAPSPVSLQSLTEAVSASVLASLPPERKTIKDRYRSDASKKEGEDQFKDDVGSDAEGNTERPRFNINLGASIGRGAKSVMDNSEEYGEQNNVSKGKIYSRLRKDIDNQKSEREYGVEGNRKIINLQSKVKRDSKGSARQPTFKTEYVSISLAQKKSNPNIHKDAQDFTVIEKRLNNSQMNIRVPNESSSKSVIKQKQDSESSHNKIPVSTIGQKARQMNSEVVNNRKSSVSSQKPTTSIKKLNKPLKSFNPVANEDTHSVHNEMSETNQRQEPQFTIIASKTALISTPVRGNKLKSEGRKVKHKLILI